LQNFSSWKPSYITMKYQFSIFFLRYFIIVFEFLTKQTMCFTAEFVTYNWHLNIFPRNDSWCIIQWYLRREQFKCFSSNVDIPRFLPTIAGGTVSTQIVKLFPV
jgi:hypothetical protein